MEKWSKLIYDMECVLLVRENAFERVYIRSFRTRCRFVLKFESARTKFESGRTQATDRFLSDFYSSYLFETPTARAREQMLIVAYNKVVKSSEY